MLSFQGDFQFFKLISGSRSGIVFFMLKIILKYLNTGVKWC